jgi:peptidyl-prolyl cis-trans isomerase C
MTLSVNGVAVSPRSEETAEVAAVRELLRQRAVATGLITDAASDENEVSAAIETLLAREVTTPEAGEAECLRYYEQHRQEFETGELLHVRHILFQVTPNVNVVELRARAEQTLRELLRRPAQFEATAREMSNCPSGQHGGNLGQISRGDTVPEFEQALFNPRRKGLLRELVKTRYGFHIIAIDQRISGKQLSFEMVRDQIAERLRSGVEQKALRQYVSVLAGQAKISGVNLAASASPLVQ